MEATAQHTLNTEAYLSAKDIWPSEGRHIYGQYDDDTIVVYQAYNNTIGKYAVANKKFTGCASFSDTRMTWIKTNFLWMMYRCDWATKDKNQTCVLAIWLKRSGFEEILAHSFHSGFKEEVYGTKENYNKVVGRGKQDPFGFVRLQWDPDHHPTGAPHPRRRAVQLGMKGVKSFINGDFIVDIQDITEYVAEQRELVRLQRFDELVVPIERVYTIESETLNKYLRIGNYKEEDERTKEEKTNEDTEEKQEEK